MGNKGTALVIGAFLTGFGFVTLSNLPVANYGKETPVINMVASPLALRTQPTLRTQPLRAMGSNEALLTKAQEIKLMKAMESEKVRCEHIMGKVMKGAAVAAPLLKGCEAMALVDERLAGEGTGKFLGINDPALGAAIVITFFTVWTLWFGAQKGMGDDTGLGLDRGDEYSN